MTARRALIVDDDPDILEIAQMSLEIAGGWLVSTAESAAIAVELAQRELPDVILMDVMMPRVDGLQALGMLQGDQRTSEIPVIFLTVRDGPAERRRLGDAGATAVLSKPFDPLSLADQIDEILHLGPSNDT